MGRSERLYEAVCRTPGEAMTVIVPVVGATAREIGRCRGSSKGVSVALGCGTRRDTFRWRATRSERRPRPRPRQRQRRRARRTSLVAPGQCPFEPGGRRPLTSQSAPARNGHEPRRRPSRCRVVDANAIERSDGRPEVRDARLMDRADLALRRAVAAACARWRTRARFSAIESVATKRISVAKPFLRASSACSIADVVRSVVSTAKGLPRSM